MILRVDAGGLLLIAQPDHAHLCGEMALAWGNRRFEPVRPLEPVARAAAEHDNGWAEWDSAPGWNPETRRPYTYRDIPIEPHLEIYRRGIARLVERDRYAGLLVSWHGTLLYSRFRREQPGAEVFLREQRALRKQLLQEMRGDAQLRPHCGAGTVETNRDLLLAWDTLSLILCLGETWVDEIELPAGYGGERASVAVRAAPGSPAGAAWTLDPYPFAMEPLRLSLPARRLEATEFAGEATFRRALTGARNLLIEIEIRARPRG